MTDKDNKLLNIFVDLDTVIVRNASVCQHDYCVYDKKGKFIESTSSIKRWVENNPNKDKEDYTFKEECVLVTPDDGSKIEWRAIGGIKRSRTSIIKALASKPELKDRKLCFFWCVQGTDNFRKDVYPRYKENRRNRNVLLRKYITDYVIRKFPNVIVSEGEETDDVVSKHCYASYLTYKREGSYPSLIAHIDKDLDTVAGWHYNYDSGALYELTPAEAFKNFCKQMLAGDETDNIKGLNKPILDDEFWEFHKERVENLRRNSKGIGMGTAEKLLDGYEHPKDMLELVTEAYKLCHEDNWVEAMQEEAIALRMRHYKDEMYDIKKTLERFDLL